MAAKRILLLVLLVIVASCLSALVAYRRGLHSGRSAGRFSSGLGRKNDCFDFREAATHAGEFACVTGEVLRVYTSRSGSTFLDFCADYRSCPFTSVIFASDRSKFGDLEALTGRQIGIHGPITTYQGHAEIIIHDPQQIQSFP